MGIHSFFSWLKSHFPECIESPGQPDTLILDMNGILHQCAQKIYKYGTKKRLLDEPEEYVNKDKDVGVEVCNEIDRLLFMVNPRKRLIMCIDGTAPASKQSQQKQRRFMAVNERDPEIKGFDSCCISPGTEFMYCVSRIIRKYIEIKRKENPSLEIVFSDDLNYGEGEHKGVAYIRSSDTNETFYIYSPDADLIMLCLGTMKNNLFVAREIDGMIKCNLYVISIDKLKQLLVSMYGWKECDTNNLCLDFILLFFMVGNDFIPNIPTLSIIENSIDRILDVYKTQSNMGYLVKYKDGDVKINAPALKNMLTQLGMQEENMINNKINSKRPYFKDTLLENNMIATEQGCKINIDRYKRDYYCKLLNTNSKINKNKTPTKLNVKKVCKDYLHGIFWTLNYYIKGVEDWEWRYPYLYAPFCSDLADHVGRFKNIEHNEPMDIYMQLMCILPPSSFNLLPPPLNEAYKDDDLKEFYPSRIEIDLSGKHFPWEGVAIVPFVDLERIRKVYEIKKEMIDKRIMRRIKNVK